VRRGLLLPRCNCRLWLTLATGIRTRDFRRDRPVRRNGTTAGCAPGITGQIRQPRRQANRCDRLPPAAARKSPVWYACCRRAYFDNSAAFSPSGLLPLTRERLLDDFQTPSAPVESRVRSLPIEAGVLVTKFGRSRNDMSRIRGGRSRIGRDEDPAQRGGGQRLRHQVLTTHVQVSRCG
jgi:hypothetical protein